MNSTDPVVIEAAKERLLQQKPLVKIYTSDHYDQLLASGEVILAHGWGGQVARAMAERPSIRYVVPKEETEFADALAAALQAVEADGSYEAALTKWGVEQGAISDFAVNP